MDPGPTNKKNYTNLWQIIYFFCFPSNSQYSMQNVRRGETTTKDQ